MTGASANGITDDVVVHIRERLLTFYDVSARDLPWRGRGDAYAIWVSEVMAQQTRIDTVIPYWHRWMTRFPDVDALADAPVDDVLKQWEGLGYYSRARNLHRAAQLVRERHAGRVPSDPDALRALPGVGDYTAGAVASMAYGRRAPAVDGNVRRVLARLLDEPAPSPARLREVAARLVPADRPGDFNQALMELGSQVCTPRAPACAACPISVPCAARAAGTQLDRPARRSVKAVPEYDVATLILRGPDGRVLLVRRPETGLLAGMWTFPGEELAAGETAADASRRVARRLGVRTRRSPTPIGAVRHEFSHRREHYLCVLLDVTATQARAASANHTDRDWVGTDTSRHTLPRAQQRIHQLVFDPAGSRLQRRPQRQPAG
ncbi:MAG TPA: A/G-specific adenine glycosylase [Longimicrobiales bacterium]|nr:A/G-specific adenine glycosylase [Longimicrobiales bacterium]